MIRIYFDLNIYTKLNKRDDTVPNYHLVYNTIKDNTDKIIIPYSPAHLQDLKQGFLKTEETKRYTYRDLNFIQELTQGHCLNECLNERVAVPIVKNAVDFFDEICSAEAIKFTDDFFDREVENDLFSQYLEKLKSFSVGINLNEIADNPQLAFWGDALVNTKIESNYYNLFKDIFNIINKPASLSKFYISARKINVGELKIDNAKTIVNPFEYFGKVYKKFKKRKTFLESIDEQFKLMYPNEKPSRFKMFSTYYLALDQHGYYSDSKFSNLVIDCLHSYYGAYCDYFITDDKNTMHKAKAVYKHLNIKTKVYNLEEFNESFCGNITNKNAIYRNLNERIIDIYNYSMIIKQSIDSDLNPVDIYNIDDLLLDYFDRMQLTNGLNSSILYFHKKRQNYSKYMFMTEIRTLVNKIVATYGNDSSSKEYFDENDKAELYNSEWSGRIWQTNRTIIQIYLDDEFTFVLKIEIIK